MENVVKKIKYFEERKKCKMLLCWMLKEMSVAIRWSSRYILQHGLVVEQWKLRRGALESQRTQGLGAQSLPLATPHLQIPSCNQKWGSAAHCSKANKEDRWVESKACFILDARNWGWGGQGKCLSKGWLPSNPTQSARAFKGRGRGLHAETIQLVLPFMAQSSRLFATPWTAAHRASLSIPNSQSPPKHMSIVSVMPSNHLILCLPLLLLPSIFPSIRVFSNESALHIRCPKYWSFSFSVSPSNEYSGLISFRMDWLDLLAVQGALKNLLQHHSSKASIFLHSAFFIVQLSHPYMTTGKTIALTRWIFVALPHTHLYIPHPRHSFLCWWTFSGHIDSFHVLATVNSEFHEQRSLMGYSPWGFKELNMTEQLTLSLSWILLYIYFSIYSFLQIYAQEWDCRVI